MRIVVAGFAMLLSSLAHSQENGVSSSSSYSFGGACASQGSWTQAALSVTQNLRRVTLQLKNDPNCQAIGQSVQTALQNLEQEVRSSSDSDRRAQRLGQIPGEISALRSFLQGSSQQQGDVLRLLMDRSIEGATLSAQVDAENRSAIAASPNANEQMAKGLMDFGSRIQHSSQVGISYLNQIVDSIPQLDQCLVGDNKMMIGTYLTGAVQLAASFVSSNQDVTGSKLATTISKLTSLSREQKFTTVLRKLNQQEFMSSMACLLEVTSESYCQARESMGLFQKGLADFKIQQVSDKNGDTKISSNNPFTGYYILNTHIPNITQWMQKIQIGVDPKLPTDAVFQNKIMNEVMEFYTGVKTLLGDYNTALMTIKTMPSLEAKQNAVYKLITQIADGMMDGRNFRSNDKTNFFLLGKNPLQIPFFLIGMQTVPDQVSGVTFPKLTYSEWLQLQLSKNDPLFRDPVALAENVGRNMQDLIKESNMAAIKYFNQWFIVDKMALMNESLVDINFTVKDSLIAVNNYLTDFKGRLIQYNGDQATVSIIIDTQSRINKVLTQYDQLSIAGSTFSKKKKIDEEDLASMAEDFNDSINLVYEQFNVMLSRSGFLANRLVNFVYQDYILLIKNKVDFTPYQKDLFIATGMGAFDRMIQIYNGNPATAMEDMNMALRINKGNLEALDLLLRDSLIPLIVEQKRIAEGKSSHISEVQRDSLKRLAHDTLFDSSRSDSEQLFPPLHPFAVWVELQIRAVKQYWNHTDRYPMTNKTDGLPYSPQSEFEDSTGLYSQFCIQALAFYNQSSFNSLCKGAILKSPFQGVSGYDISYDQVRLTHLKDDKISPQQRISLNHSDRICAFRDFNRKNMVLFMQMGKR
ncbi:MAG: hypothetical protein AAGB31_02135 [Bdellovibrio sp.]